MSASREIPLPVRTVLDAFEEHARERSGAPAIHYFDETLSFGEVNRRADAFASLLAEWEIGKGDRVAISLQNDPEFVIAQFGAWKRGAIVVPLNPMFKQKELAYHLTDSGARAWVTPDSMDETLRAVAVDRVITASQMPRQGHAPRLDVSGDDIAYLVYTSGTTGPSKGSMGLHRSIAFNAEVFRRWMALGAGDAILGMAPLFHITGLVAHICLSAWVGIPLILFHRFDAVEALRLAEKWHATFSIAAITAYIAILNSGASRLCLTKCYSGGAPIAPSITEQFESRFGVYIHNIYGLTETNSPSHATPLGMRAPVHAESGALSIGVPVSNCLAKIVDLSDPSRELPTGEAGELVLRGPMVFAGYWQKPEETHHAFHDGWFRTGDVAIMDADGWFYVVDRKKDMIVASGFKIWPREVEDTLYQHPAVREAAVIGVPDAYRGETVKAFVALKQEYAGRTDAAEIIAFCRSRLAAYKYPREVEFVAEIPKTATGKFLRRALRG